MTDEELLLRAVLAAPDDDLPRLVYADWLDEHGQGERIPISGKVVGDLIGPVMNRSLDLIRAVDGWLASHPEVARGK